MQDLTDDLLVFTDEPEGQTATTSVGEDRLLDAGEALGERRGA